MLRIAKTRCVTYTKERESTMLHECCVLIAVKKKAIFAVV